MPPRCSNTVSTVSLPVYIEFFRRLETLNELRTKELERSLANRESALRSIYATRAPLSASAGVAPYAARYGFGNVGMSDDLRAEQAFLDQRRALYSDLRSAEANEVASAEKRLADERNCEKKLVDEREQAR